ncbi:MAG: class I SAM-dependent methyltransferase [Thermodesulfobacteriota bacterium]|nr:class I SAM-dependent methyltransferase [Thermodesulfobacteriota bacterium]
MDKESIILNHCRGKKVIDIGCVQELSDFSSETMKQTLHYKLKQEIPDLVGIDLEPEGVHALNQLGCDCHVAFAEEVQKLALGSFEVIILGDIIEHIPDPCMFLFSLRSILKKYGVIVCTTPNAMSYINSVFLFLSKKITRYQHVAWYCRVTLRNMFKHAGFEEQHFYFLDFHKTTKKFWRVWLEKPLFAYCQELSPHICGVYSINPDFSFETKKELQQKRLHL